MMMTHLGDGVRRRRGQEERRTGEERERRRRGKEKSRTEKQRI